MKNQIELLYQQLLTAWNHQDAHGMAKLFTEKGVQIGYDGSEVIGSVEIFSHLNPIFEDHPTAQFVSKVKEIRYLSSEAAILRAIAGMVPPGKSDINPQVNTHHTIVAIKNEGNWSIELFQNTPAQFHGRPELVEQMTEELRELLK